MQGLLAANAAQMQNFTVSIINNPISDVKCFVRRCLGVQKDLSLFMRICCFGALLRGLRNLEAPLKGFNCCGAKLRLRCANSRFAEPRSFLKKVLIVAVRSYSYSVLIQGLRNLETSCEGIRVVTFCIVQKVTKKHAGLRPATSIQIAGRYVFEAKMTGVH